MSDTNATPATSVIRRARWPSPMPLFFVVLWSTGFIAAKYGLPYAPPLSFLIVRCLGAVAILLPVVLLTGASWPRRQMSSSVLGATRS